MGFGLYFGSPYQVAGAGLPLSGGTMTGTITTSANPAISCTTHLVLNRSAGLNFEVQLNGAGQFRANTSGQWIGVTASEAFGWSGRSLITSPADGNVLLTNNAGTDFSRLQFGGTTSSFPALKRNGALLEFVVADNSTSAQVKAQTFIDTNANSAIGNGGVGLASSSTLVWGNGAAWNSTADSRVRRVAANVIGLDNGTAGKLAALEFAEDSTTDIGAGAVGSARLYARDNGAGKTQLCVRFATGAVQVLATEP